MKKLLLFIFLIPSLAFSACITDDVGEKVCLDAPPARVVSLYGAFTELVVELGAGASIIARTKSDDTLEELKDAPVLGTGLRPNVEYIMALRPDLIISRGGKSASEALTSLKARGLAVAAFDPTTIAETYSAVERLGILFGRAQEAGELTRKTREGLAKVAEKAKKAKSIPTVAFEVRAEPLTLSGKGGLVAEIIDIAGGKVCVEVDKKLVRFDMEALLKADPDAYIVQEGPMNKNPPRPEERPFHANLRAVREKRVLYVDEKLISRPGPRIAEAAETISRFLHPQLWQ